MDCPGGGERNLSEQGRGRVSLVGGGPGPADLISLRGYRALLAAEVVLYDSLVDPEVLAEVPCETIYVGKRCGEHAMTQEQICALLAEHALAGKHVVRLKGGDPMVLGRGGEEARYLGALGIPVTLVPGITSSVAAPELAGIPVTHRGVSDSFHVVSAHRRNDEQEFSLPPFHPRTTLVILMGVRTLPVWREQLRGLGYPDDLPVAFVTSGGWAQQQVVVSTLEHAQQDAEDAGVDSPTTAVVGHVVSLRDAILGLGVERAVLG